MTLHLKDETLLLATFETAGDLAELITVHSEDQDIPVLVEIDGQRTKLTRAESVREKQHDGSSVTRLVLSGASAEKAVRDVSLPRMPAGTFFIQEDDDAQADPTVAKANIGTVTAGTIEATPEAKALDALRALVESWFPEMYRDRRRRRYL